MAQHPRPLSPHIGIWRWRLHMALSIQHRLAGLASVAAALLLVWWLTALASGPDYHAYFLKLIGGAVGHIVLFLLTLALMLHLGSGIKHLVMDTGAGLEPDKNRQLGSSLAILAVVLTLAIWIGARLVLQGN
ncbi:succinate dehydrogenase subunit C [Rhodothalassium salexigens DSM 2132]|uniref:Succinate dehydrogenase cytochrome b556 subunit n=1 Tax=Rhodothalassium salexigens DSM 2132 TaxID=1188247 RepID=A0A4R2PDX0_RHOSA|nr:succinate dehydrogenase, cytochrome b556 subunit [Rhodothalassium salexigens]MBB4211997.1 succinate dehydrogenase / fumarate reductase cytochrome b subunit [Rhodothalassium salexigens DSM 2132]MBK1638517.1 succinate dehydrogenase, cytochrome b556 subunit [Rhodothalassium salexigens DSM 2132]TCP33419.1 succinate dehydrogenase subunit C [Rhodothalassium salexigens DSM 2132]